MEEISLGDLVLKMGQASVARALGAKPSSIAKAIRTGRSIIVTVADDGSCVGKETRPFPSQSAMQFGCKQKSDLESGLGKANGHLLA
jgi:hypothetical protein